MMSRLIEICSRLNEYELRALTYVAEGMDQGAKVYGHFDPYSEKRDLRLEEAAEWRDAIVYRALQRVMVESGQG